MNRVDIFGIFFFFQKGFILRLPSTREQLFGFNVPGHWLVWVCVVVFAAFKCVYDSTMVYASLCTNNATFTHAQGSDWTCWSQELALWLKAIVEYSKPFFSEIHFVFLNFSVKLNLQALEDSNFDELKCVLFLGIKIMWSIYFLFCRPNYAQLLLFTLELQHKKVGYFQNLLYSMNWKSKMINRVYVSQKKKKKWNA